MANNELVFHDFSKIFHPFIQGNIKVKVKFIRAFYSQKDY